MTDIPTTKDACLREALRPFAEAAATFRPDDADSMRPAIVQAVHYRHAAKVFAALAAPLAPEAVKVDEDVVGRLQSVCDTLVNSRANGIPIGFHQLAQDIKTVLASLAIQPLVNGTRSDSPQRVRAAKHMTGDRHLVITPTDLNPCGSCADLSGANEMAEQLRRANPGQEFFVMSPASVSIQPLVSGADLAVLPDWIAEFRHLGFEPDANALQRIYDALAGRVSPVKEK